MKSPNLIAESRSADIDRNRVRNAITRARKRDELQIPDPEWLNAALRDEFKEDPPAMLRVAFCVALDLLRPECDRVALAWTPEQQRQIEHIVADTMWESGIVPIADVHAEIAKSVGWTADQLRAGILSGMWSIMAGDDPEPIGFLVRRELIESEESKK